MSALKMILAGGVAAAALVSAAPASAQYYPGNPYGYGYGGGQVPGGGYGGYGAYGGYGNNSQAAISQCTAAVSQRLNRNQGGYGAYGGGYGAYGGGYGGARVLGISRVEPSSGGGLTIRGVASSGFNAGYGGYGNGGSPDLTFRCRTDYRGFVVDVDVDRAQRNYGNGYQPYGNGYQQPYGNGYQQYDNPYSAYGYRRY
jgi:hypothetical protein